MIPLFGSRILHACPVIESHDVDLIPARTHDAVIRDLPEKSLVRRRRFGRKLQRPFVTKDFHFGAECLQSRADAFVLFRDPIDGPVDRSLIDQTLKLFISAQAQHLFPAAGGIALPEIDQENVEQRLEFERAARRKHSDQFLGNVVGCATRERDGRSFGHL